MKLLVAGLLVLPMQGTQQGSTQDLLVKFTRRESHAEARDALLELPPEKVVMPLVEALRKDEAFASSTLYRAAAYDLLAKMTEEGPPDGRATYQNPDQVRQLFAGLHDASRTVRGLCLRAMGRVGPDYRLEAAQAAMPFLTDEDPQVIAVAVGVTTELGPASTAALPALRTILIEGPAIPPDYSGEGAADPTKLRQQIRHSAAFARIVIAGVGVDLDTYPQLDAPGRAAAVDALAPVLMRDQMARNDPKSSVPTSGAPPITPRERGKLVSFLQEHAGDPESETSSRAKAILLLGVIGSRQDPHDEAASAAVRHLQRLSGDKNAAISKAAKQQLKALGK